MVTIHIKNVINHVPLVQKLELQQLIIVINVQLDIISYILNQVIVFQNLKNQIIHIMMKKMIHIKNAILNVQLVKVLEIVLIQIVKHAHLDIISFIQKKEFVLQKDHKIVLVI
jgi:hypothetical protein